MFIADSRSRIRIFFYPGSLGRKKASDPGSAPLCSGDGGACCLIPDRSCWCWRWFCWRRPSSSRWGSPPLCGQSWRWRPLCRCYRPRPRVFGYRTSCLDKQSVLRIRIRIRRIRMCSGLLDPDPDPLVRGMDPDTGLLIWTVGYIDFKNVMWFASKKLPYNIYIFFFLCVGRVPDPTSHFIPTSFCM